MKKALILRCSKENNINTQSGFTFLGFFKKKLIIREIKNNMKSTYTGNFRHVELKKILQMC